VRRLLFIPLAAVLYAGTAAAEDRPPKSPPPPPPPATERARPKPDTSQLSAEDREVVDNLELLESMDAAQDLDLLMELSQDDDSPPK
jgi:hypothetical protein